MSARADGFENPNHALLHLDNGHVRVQTTARLKAREPPKILDQKTGDVHVLAFVVPIDAPVFGVSLPSDPTSASTCFFFGRRELRIGAFDETNDASPQDGVEYGSGAASLPRAPRGGATNESMFSLDWAIVFGAP